MTKPAPLVPAECTMAGNDWFPLHFERLRKSKWWRRASDLARARNVMMWGEAYKQVPAGSMPDDDDDLAEAAGFGMDVEAFLAVKAEIMAPWVLCTDGRWYHPTLCEVVLDAWERAGDRRKKAAERQRRRRDQVRGGTAESAPVTPESGDVTREDAGVTRDSGDVTRDFGIHNRQDITDRTEPPLPPKGDGGLFGDDGQAKPPDEVRIAFDLWNEVARRCGLPIAEALTDTRRRGIASRLKGGGLERWASALSAVEVSRFCRGMEPGRDGRKPFRADLDFVCQAKSFQRLIEGFYGRDAEPPPVAPVVAPPVEDGPPWRRRVRAFAVNVYWEREWGPRPGQPGCLAPPEVLREFGIEPAPPQPVGGRAA